MLLRGGWWRNGEHRRCVPLGKVVGRRCMGRPARVGTASNTVVVLRKRTRSDNSEIVHLHACKHGGCTFFEVGKMPKAI